MKGITAFIYRSKHFPARNERNALASFDEVTVIGTSSDGGVTVKPLVGGVFEPTEKAPAVVLIYRTMGSQRLVHAIPANLPKHFEGRVGPFAGGAYIDASDSRVRDAIGFHGAVSLHDAYETQRDYDRNYD